VATKLGLWNSALYELGHRPLTDTGEAVEAGRALAHFHSQVVEECLASGSWNFAMETIKATADTGVTPNFGYTEVFAKPADWLRTIGVSEDENFSLPLIHYYDDSNFWSANSSPIYIRYVSDDTGLGLFLTNWPAQFTRYVELELATRIAPKIARSEFDRVSEMRDNARKRAKNTDAMNEPQPKFAPPGSWTQSRGGGRRGDRGSRGSLTG
jgi:hypothetical protein